MVVCHCLAMNDRAITELVDHPGVTVEDITARCGAGGECGGCHNTIAELLERLETAVSLPSAA